MLSPDGEAESGSTCSVAVAGPGAPPAVITAATGWFTAKVMIGNVATAAPGSTVTAAGTTAAAGSLLVRVRVTPPTTAGCARLTSPRASIPPATGFGKRVSAIGAGVGGGTGGCGGIDGGRICSEAVAVAPGEPALIVAVVAAVTL